MQNLLARDSQQSIGLSYTFYSKAVYNKVVGDLLLCWTLWSSFSFRQEKGGERSICELRRDSRTN